MELPGSTDTPSVNRATIAPIASKTRNRMKYCRVRVTKVVDKYINTILYIFLYNPSIKTHQTGPNFFSSIGCSQKMEQI